MRDLRYMHTDIDIFLLDGCDLDCMLHASYRIPADHARKRSMFRDRLKDDRSTQVRPGSLVAYGVHTHMWCWIAACVALSPPMHSPTHPR